MREAQKSALNGHRAAKETFCQAYANLILISPTFSACGHHDTDVPYDNTIVLNEHAAALYYTCLDQRTSNDVHNFLNDAGTVYNGYAADLTRTYMAQKDNDFAALITAMNNEQLVLISTIETVIDYH